MRASAALALGGLVALGCGGSEATRRDGGAALAEEREDSAPADGEISNDIEDFDTARSEAGADSVVEVGDLGEDVDPDAPVLTEPGTFVAGEADLPDEYVFKSVWAGEAGRIVAVGNDGVVATQAPDGLWQVLSRAAGVDLLNAVHGTDRDHLFAVGIDGAILHGSVSAFAAVTSGLTDTLWAVHALAPDNAFAVGKGGTIAHWDGQRWERGTATDAQGVWNGLTSAGGTVALVGNGGQAVLSRGAGIERVSTGIGVNLHGVHTLDGQEFFAVGDQGALLHGTGTSWSPTDRGLVMSLRDVHGRAGDVYAVGYGGALVHWNGTGWDLLASPTTKNLLGVWVTADGRAIVVGQDGVVLEGDAASGFAVTAALLEGGELTDVWGTPEGAFVVAVGTQGRIFSRVDGAWSAMTSPTSQGLESVWGTSPTDVWAVGRSGYAAHWNGSEWTRAETPVSALIAAVWGDAEGHYLAAGSGGTLLAWNGSSWQSVASGTTNNLRALASRGDDLWAVGAKATILRFNGLGWGAATVQGIPNADGGQDPIEDELFGIWLAADEDGWAVGENGRILRWDGAMWRIVETEWTTSLRAVYGLASNDVWAVGTAGHIIHWNGEAWDAVANASIATLYAIHGDGAGYVIAVGDLGTVLRLDRGPSELSRGPSSRP